MIKGDKRIIKSIFKNLDFKYRVYKKNNHESYTLIIPGWQSTHDIFHEIISKLNSNVISFDYAGIGDNEYSDELTKTYYNKSHKIHTKVVEFLFKNYNITSLTGTSAGTVFIPTWTNIIPSDTNILLTAPQLLLSSVDEVMSKVLRLILKLELLFDRPIYYSFSNTALISKLWLDLVCNNSKRQFTRQIVSKTGIESAKKFWTLQHFLDLYNFKKIYKRGLIIDDFLKEQKVLIYVGKLDNFVDIDKLKVFLRKYGFDDENIIIGKSNHIIETESEEEVINLLNKH